MNRLDDIPVSVRPARADIRLGNALPVLHEIAGRLQDLIETGRTHIIDLQALPLAPGDREYLLEILGEGELTAQINALGPSRVSETAIHGVWWITHTNSHDQVIAEFIEVTCLPDILRSQTGDIQAAAQRLRERLDSAGAPP